MSQDIVAKTAEAVCSALYQMGFALLGEPNGPRGQTWWVIDRFPHDVRAVVSREWDDDVVRVTVEWHNIALPPRILKGSQELRLSCNSSMMTVDREKAVEAAVHRILEIYREVLERKGAAGPVAVRNTRKRPDST